MIDADTQMLLAQLDKLKREEDEFFARQGFPDYQTVDDAGKANDAHVAWLEAVAIETKAFQSPMARKMFVLGWLKGQQRTGGGR